eukprot:m.39870 g.39870  ORF g.39870 m.39870 type:complete len:327 (+) comp6891_c0_seq1:15-995(+)
MMIARLSLSICFLVVLIFLLGDHDGVNCLVASSNGNLRLNQVPFIFSHDAATGYLENNIVNRWAKTQSTTFAGQLDCGSRGFDLRPNALGNGGGVVMHHGDVIVHEQVHDAMVDVLNWTLANPNELVIIYVTDCEGDNCEGLVRDIFTNLTIPFISDCEALQNLTYVQAQAMAAKSNKGMPLAIFGCVDEQYDPSIECYLTTTQSSISNSTAEKVDVCYEPASRLVPLTKFWSYLVESTSIPLHTDDGMLWMAQAHWQYSVESVSIGLLHDSSILLDESKSKTNAMLVGNITSNAFKYANIVELDNVCDGGNKILTALRKVFLTGR